MPTPSTSRLKRSSRTRNGQTSPTGRQSSRRTMRRRPGCWAWSPTRVKARSNRSCARRPSTSGSARPSSRPPSASTSASPVCGSPTRTSAVPVPIAPAATSVATAWSDAASVPRTPWSRTISPSLSASAPRSSRCARSLPSSRSTMASATPDTASRPRRRAPGCASDGIRPRPRRWCSRLVPGGRSDFCTGCRMTDVWVISHLASVR